MELLERGPLLLELSRLLGEVGEGSGRLAFLGGEAGIGKTALVRRFGEVVRERTPLLVGACDPLSTPRPLGPLLDVADRLPGASIRTAEGKDSLFRDTLAALSAPGRPPVVVFEDVHWADEATLDLLRYLARRIEGCRVLLIATYREDEVGDRHPLRLVLGDVATAPGVRRLALAPLTAGAVRALAAGSGLDAEELHRQTGGNPFYVTEILAAGGERIPATVRDAVLARAARLPEGARAVLDAAAVIGLRSEPWLLQEVAGGEAGGAEACLASGMLTVQEEAYAFRHELAREAVLGAVVPHRRVELHRRVLEALRAAAGAEPARLAHHAEEAGDGAGVLQLAPEAARRASALSAHREAAAQYARALRFAQGLSDAGRAELLGRYSFECAVSDQYPEAVRAHREVVRISRGLGDRLREGEALSELAGFLVFLGRNAEAEEASRDAIGLLEALPPGPELAEAYAGQATLRMLNRDNAEAVRWARKALELAEPGGYLRTRIKAYNRLGSARIVGGDPGGEPDLRRALELARGAGLHWDAASAYGNLGSGWGEWYEFARAEPYLDEGIAYATEHEAEANLVYMLSWQALVRLYLGRWPEAEASAERVTQRTGASVISRIMALVALGRLKVRRGDPAAAELLDEALALALPTGTLQRLAPVRAARAEAAWLAGDPGRVREEAGSALELAVEHRHPWFTGELLCWLARAGEPVEAPEYVGRPFALQLAGRWAEAADEWRRRGCPYEAAQALAESAEPEDLRAALAGFERLGARPAAQRTHRRLRELGVRGVPRGPRPSTRDNPAGLTRREAEVARLLAEGLRNAEIARRLFLSPKTVDHHVSRVLAKLGVHTRGEAARAAERLGISQDGEPGAPR
ncbi:MAG TPA: AAA family ATPase [Longimicrobiaceae bacterium]|nr:AAA family ATPase [Longimicrobiaceae bacterium]